MNNNNGLSRTRLYTIFSGMKQRCYNPKTKNFNWYGGRGIAICDEWMGEHGVSNFIEWALNNGYEEHLTIDRIDPNGDYSPTNCQWITQNENSSRARHTAKPRTRPSGGDTMSIKYYKLLDLLNKRKISKGRLQEMADISSATMAKISAGKPVSLEVINRICKALQVQPGDILEYIDE